MKKGVFFGVGLVLLTLVTTACWGSELPYIGLSVGIVMPNDSSMRVVDDDISFKYDDGFAAAVALGQRFGRFRGEIEFSYLRFKLDTATYQQLSTSVDGAFSSLSLLANGYLDFVNDSAVTPFLTAGIGGSRVRIGDTGYAALEGDNDTVFAYQVGAGVGVALDTETSIELKYRYFGTEDLNFERGKMNFSAHNLFCCLRYSF